MEKGIINKVSNQSFDTTYRKLIEHIENNSRLRLLAELDHQSCATEAGIRLDPMKVIIFDNPHNVTSLLQDSLTSGLDLPQKILVYQNKLGIVNVAYNDPTYLKKRHNISNARDELAGISNELESITNAATL